MKKIIILLSIVAIVSSCYVLNNPFSGYYFSNDILTREGTVTVSLFDATDKNNKECIFYLYKGSIDNTQDYIGNGSMIIQNGGGSSIIYDATTDHILKMPYGKFVSIYGYINDNSYPIYSENATNLTGYNTVGNFGQGRRLLKSNGDVITEGEQFDYQYDSQLTIYDDKTNDNFISGKYFRIIHDNFNLSDTITNGLGLIPMAKNLKYSKNMFPAYPYFFIDPDRGKFVLPRPLYWSKMEDYADIITPEISNSTDYTPIVENYPSYYQGFSSSGIYGFCYKISLPGNNDTLSQDFYTIKPFGNNKLNWIKGSLSTWVHIDSDENTSGYISLIGETSDLKILALSDEGHFYIKLFVKGLNDNMPEAYMIDDSLENSWVNIFAIWDMEGNLTHSKHIKVFINGNIGLSSDKTVDLSEHNFIIKSYANDGFSVGYPTTTSIDNVMIWDHVICDESSDYISYIYSNRNNPVTESAIHPCYTKKFNYQPSSNIKVGYYSGGVLWPNSGELYFNKNKILINNDLNINFNCLSLVQHKN